MLARESPEWIMIFTNNHQSLLLKCEVFFFFLGGKSGEIVQIVIAKGVKLITTQFG
jgi:hypothetical protein